MKHSWMLHASGTSPPHWKGLNLTNQWKIICMHGSDISSIRQRIILTILGLFCTLLISVETHSIDYGSTNTISLMGYMPDIVVSWCMRQIAPLPTHNTHTHMYTLCKKQRHKRLKWDKLPKIIKKTDSSKHLFFDFSWSNSWQLCKGRATCSSVNSSILTHIYKQANTSNKKIKYSTNHRNEVKTWSKALVSKQNE